jgi:Domain of unknown function (DUF5666)
MAQMSPYPYPNRYPGQQRRGTSRPSAQPDKGNSTDPLPSFAGTVRGLDSKLLTLERPDENTLEFNCSKKTKYYDGDKKIKVSAVKPGDQVSVDAKRAIDGSLDAVNVRLEHPKPAGSSSSGPS